MSDRDALLAAIRHAPQDDAPRLVFADWLDEHGERERAEFVRLQVEIDPYRQPDSDLDRWRRAVIDRHLDRPVPPDFPPELHRYAGLARRERDLLKAHQWDWLGPLVAVDEDYESHLSVTYRRGFADEVGLTTSAFLEAGDDVRSACPMLRRLTLYGPRDRVPELVGMTALNGIPELDLAGWITPYDARFLGPSFALREVGSLTLWVGSGHDSEVTRTLATRAWEGGPRGASGLLAAGPHLPELREVVLVQLGGGVLADDQDGGLDRRADALAAEFNRQFGRPVARVERPFARRFPLNGVLGRGLLAGTMGGRSVLVRGGRRPAVLEFDADGRLIAEDEWDLTAQLNRPPRWGWLDYDEDELLDLLRRSYGYQPGIIFVREFSSAVADVAVYPWGSHEDVVVDPAEAAPADGDEYEELCASLDAYWWKGGNFVALWGNDYLLGPDGTIHSS